MNNLPGDSQDLSQNATVGQASITPQGKEGESVHILSQETPLQAVGHEVELSQELISTGVEVQSGQVNLPQNLVNQGVQVTNQPAPLTNNLGSGVILPLTDEQIATGLHASVTSSVRWLAEWCVRKMKIVHKAVTGKVQTP